MKLVNSRKMYSTLLNKTVRLMKYVAEGEESKYAWCECTRCGKDIKKTMYVVQDDETDVEEMYLGSCCVKKFS